MLMTVFEYFYEVLIRQNKGLGQYRKEPILEPDPLNMEKTGTSLKPFFKFIYKPETQRKLYLYLFKNRNGTGNHCFL